MEKTEKVLTKEEREARGMLHELDLLGFDEFNEDCLNYVAYFLCTIKDIAYTKGYDEGYKIGYDEPFWVRIRHKIGI